jgi:hypothetical protein
MTDLFGLLLSDCRAAWAAKGHWQTRPRRNGGLRNAYLDRPARVSEDVGRARQVFASWPPKTVQALPLDLAVVDNRFCVLKSAGSLRITAQLYWGSTIFANIWRWSVVMDAPDGDIAATGDASQIQSDIQALERLYRAMRPEQRSFFRRQIMAHLEGAPNMIDHCSNDSYNTSQLVVRF